MPDTALAALTFRALVNFSIAILGERGRSTLYAAANAASADSFAQRISPSTVDARDEPQHGKERHAPPTMDPSPSQVLPLSPPISTRAASASFNGSGDAADAEAQILASALADFEEHWGGLVLRVATRDAPNPDAAVEELFARVRQAQPSSLTYVH